MEEVLEGVGKLGDVGYIIAPNSIALMLPDGTILSITTFCPGSTKKHEQSEAAVSLSVVRRYNAVKGKQR